MLQEVLDAFDSQLGEGGCPFAGDPERDLTPAGRIQLETARRSGYGIGHASTLVSRKPAQATFARRADSEGAKNAGILLRRMASVCDVCGKTPGFGNNISHSHRRSRRRWNPNVQRVRALVNGTVRRMNVCAKCLKANKVKKAI
jgi:large subunit ribosomal protein L28